MEIEWWCARIWSSGNESLMGIWQENEISWLALYSIHFWCHSGGTGHKSEVLVGLFSCAELPFGKTSDLWNWFLPVVVIQAWSLVLEEACFLIEEEALSKWSDCLDLVLLWFVRVQGRGWLWISPAEGCLLENPFDCRCEHFYSIEVKKDHWMWMKDSEIACWRENVTMSHWLIFIFTNKWDWFWVTCHFFERVWFLVFFRQSKFCEMNWGV